MIAHSIAITNDDMTSIPAATSKKLDHSTPDDAYIVMLAGMIEDVHRTCPIAAARTLSMSFFK
jgi:hypothetical protein